MHKFISVALILFASTVNAQTIFPGSFAGYTQRGAFANNIQLNDSIANKKWSFNRYSGISTSFSFFNGGNATIVSVPVGLQLNRRLNNNLYAFANVAVAPSYINFNRSFITADISKTNQHKGFARSNGLGVYSGASLGLMYVNDAKTFSISGSISMERSNYPLLPYYPVSTTIPNATIPAYRK
ncbi:MAG: hypothetical protein ABIS01_12830 [Ferruginibacter sp.]